MWEAYKKFIRQLPCAICADDTGCDPHHDIGNKGPNCGIKSHDIRTMPLCRVHHSELHDIGPEAFELRYGIRQTACILDCIEKAVYQGVISLNKEMI